MFSFFKNNLTTAPRLRGECFFFFLFLILILPLAAADVDIRCTPQSVTAYQGEKVMLKVEIQNNTATTYRPKEGFFLSYHLYDNNGKTLSYDNRRFVIPRVLRRRKTVVFDVPVYFDYKDSGNYTVALDIVKEGEFWGSARKWGTAEVKLRLKPLFSDEFRKQYMPRFKPTGNKTHDNAHHLLRVTLKNCELYHEGKLFGFAAGSDYPAAWIRDTATFIAYAKQYYPLEVLAGMIARYLEHQGGAGEIVDWVDTSGKTGKNTAATDQESSLVLAACEIAEDKKDWLDQTVKGKKIVDRLDMALEWIWSHRRDKEWNLITSGFTADWGDVEKSYPDERANDLSDRSIPVVGIYVQAKYIQAVSAYLKLIGKLPGQAKRIKKWVSRLGLLKRNTKKYLYLKDRGYYIVHRVRGAEAEKYFKMEQGMLALGGNAEAIEAGLMTADEIKRFLSVLEQRRGQYKLRTVSFTLVPPYPEGFFPHHLLAHPWSYQNGGEWDWIGGRLVKALFKNGFETAAGKYLDEIIQKNISNYCIFEWEDRTGTGRGALYYAGAAGVIGESLQLAK